MATSVAAIAERLPVWEEEYRSDGPFASSFEVPAYRALCREQAPLLLAAVRASLNDPQPDQPRRRSLDQALNPALSALVRLHTGFAGTPGALADYRRAMLTLQHLRTMANVIGAPPAR